MEKNSAVLYAPLMEGCSPVDGWQSMSRCIFQLSRRDREFLPFSLMFRDEIENFHNFTDRKFGQNCFLKLLLLLLSKCPCVRRVKVQVASKGLV